MDRRRVKILNVDDDEAGRYAMSRTLRSAGFEVTEAGTGAEALRLVSSENPDLVILDVRLPDLNGVEVCRKIKSNPATAAVPVIHVSATLIGDADRARGLESGADGYLVEPVSPEVLVASVRALLRMRRAEEAVLASLKNWQTTFDALSDGLGLLDREGRLKQQNRALSRILGQPPEAMIGRRVQDLLPPSVGKALEPILLEALRARAARSLEVPLDDRRLYVTFDPVPDGSGSPAAAVCVVSEITERYRSQERLTALMDELEAQLGDMIRLHELNVTLSATLDLKATVEQVLTAVTALMRAPLATLALHDPIRNDLQTVASIGFSADSEERVGRIPLGRGDRGAAIAERRRIIIGDVESDPLYEPYREAARRAGYRSVDSIPLFTRDKSPLGVITTYFREPPASSERENRLVELYCLHASEFIENAQLYRKIQDDDRRKDEFLAMLAHELRNPLSPILNAVEALRTGRLDAADQEWATEVVERQVHNMARLIDDLMDVSRISRGLVELRKESVDLRTIVDRAMETSLTILEEREHKLEVSLPAQGVWVEADPIRLEQVLSNLMNNAAKYTPKRGRIAVALQVEGQEAVLRVIDSGIGIAPDLLPRIFDLFMQASRSLDRSQGGLGIGLTVVKSLVEMHGGRVEAHSEGPGKGSEMRVRLPVLGLRPAHRPPAVAAPDAEPGSGTDSGSLPGRDMDAPALPRRILVVDDNLDAAKMMSALLESQGHEVRITHDGPSTLKLVETFNPQVVLLDIGLPGMDGYQVARELRSRERFRDTLLVALTGYGQAEDRRLSRESGFDHHLVKPVDSRAIHRLLSGAEVRKA